MGDVGKRMTKVLSGGSGCVITGDCLEVMKQIPDESVDAVIADPPYGYFGENLEWDVVIPLEPMWEELKRVIKPAGIIVMTSTQPFTTALISSNTPWFKYSMVWVKTKPSGYQICMVKPLAAHEDILVFGKGGGTYNPQMVKRSSPVKVKVHSTNRQIVVSGGGLYENTKVFTHKYPTTVINIPNGSQKGKLHSTQKPVALMAYLIRSYTNPGELVLDFAAGSGTTGVACVNMGRRYICIEKDEKYARISRKRIRRTLRPLLK